MNRSGRLQALLARCTAIRRGGAMRLPLAAVLLAGAAWHAPAAALTREEVEATLAAAMTQVTNQYVDPIDSRTLAVHGLRTLKDVPGVDNPTQRAAIEQAVLAGHQVKGIAPQTRMLADEILRFADGQAREAALGAVLRGMMAGLDTYSRFVTPAELAPPPASVGLEVSIQGGRLTVVRPLPGSPGERAGIRAGDVVTHVDGRATDGLPLPEAVALLRGPTGTPVTLVLQRPGTADPVTAQAVRGPVAPPPMVRGDLHGAIAVIQISAFDSKTGGQLRDAVKAAAARATPALEGLVLDLRGNAGGLLDVAEQVAGMALPSGAEIGSLRGRTPGNARPLRARSQLVAHDVLVAVLVDQRSGAGAEIVAAALQDHGRALLIGSKTRGAGTVQTVLRLPGDQGALLATTARFYRANGARIDSVGVTPDMLLDDTGRRVSVRGELAADFKPALIQRVQAALADAPAGADTAMLAALTVLSAAASCDKDNC